MAAPLLPLWERRLVGPDAFLPASIVRTPAAPGPAIAPGDLVLVSPSDAMSLTLPDPRLSPGRMIAVGYDGEEELVTWSAFPGTLVNGGATWAAGGVGPWGGYVFVSDGEMWRTIARFTGV